MKYCVSVKKKQTNNIHSDENEIKQHLYKCWLCRALLYMYIHYCTLSSPKSYEVGANIIPYLILQITELQDSKAMQ